MVAQASSEETLLELFWCCSSPALLTGKGLLHCSVAEERDRRGCGVLRPPSQEEFEVTEENQRLLRKANLGCIVDDLESFRPERSPWET